MFFAIAIACGLSTSTVAPDCYLAAAKQPMSTREECEMVLSSMKDSLGVAIDKGQLPETAYIHDARCLFVPEAL